MTRLSVVVATCGAVLVAAVPALAAGVAPRTEVIRAPAASPLDLVGTGFAWGVRTGKGDRLPAGGSLVRGWVAFPAGTARGATASLALRCPAGQRVVELADLWARPPLRLERYVVRYDRSTAVTFRWTTGSAVTAQRTGRAALVCFDAQRLAALRTRQERDIVRRAAARRPDVRTAPRRLLCRDTYVQVRPAAGGVIGNVSRGDPVRVFRRSASGRYTEILGLRAFSGLGWVRTSALC